MSLIKFMNIMALRPLCKELQQKAIAELHEDPKRIQEDLDYIKSWLAKQSHINARQDDQFLIAFLRGCKYSLERCKEKLDMFHTIKSITPEIYSNRDPMAAEIQELLSLGAFLPLSKLPDPASPRFMLFRGGIYDPSKIDQPTIFKLNMMIQDIIMMEDDNYIVAGGVFVQDMDGVGMNHVIHMSPSLTKKAMVCFQEAMPNRIKGMHMINIPSVFETIHKMFAPFMNQKMKSRMHIYTSKDLDKLWQVVPREVMPEEYGGNGGKIDDIINEWKKKVESYQQWFSNDEQYKTNESKRPGKPKSSDSVFGLGTEGSFRQLNVD